MGNLIAGVGGGGGGGGGVWLWVGAIWGESGGADLVRGGREGCCDWVGVEEG